LAKRSCIFSDASGPLTNEHVIPQWLQQYLGDQEKGSFRGTHVSSVGMSLSERIASGNSHKLGTVCGTCNHGWMSSLEGAFGRLLPRLQADMSPRKFSKEERRIIALWIVKTGIIAHHGSNYRTILPAWVPRTMSQGTTVPAGIKVFGGSVEPEKTIRWVQSNIGVAVVQRADVSEFENGKKHICVCAFDQEHFDRFWVTWLKPRRVSDNLFRALHPTHLSSTRARKKSAGIWGLDIGNDPNCGASQEDLSAHEVGL
jgi:hypothetical protein